MPGTLSASDILEKSFLEIRHHILDVAAGMDRLDEAADFESIESDPRLNQLRDALVILSERDPGRAARVQMAFSRKYDENWERPVSR
jgi:hypothetical protein